MRRAGHPQFHRGVSAIANNLLTARVSAHTETELHEQVRLEQVRVIHAGQLAVIADIVLEDAQITSRPRSVVPAKALSGANGHAVAVVKPVVDLPEETVPMIDVIRGRLVVVAGACPVRQW